MSENIHQAINAVMKEVGYVQKEKSEKLSYTFAGEAALIQALRPEMVKNGLYMNVSEIKEIRRSEYTTKSGTAMQMTLIAATMRITHVPSGESIFVEAVGEGADAGDKSANKAMTGLYKYGMRQTFMIETGDDPDKEASQERVKKEAPKKQEQKAPEGEIIPDATWKEFSALVEKASAAGINLPGYERAKMTPALVEGATKYIQGKLGK